MGMRYHSHTQEGVRIIGSDVCTSHIDITIMRGKSWNRNVSRTDGKN